MQILTPYRSTSLLFVTGRLAEASLRETLQPLSETLGFRFEIAVPGVQVAALLSVSLLEKRLCVPDHIDRVILPGWCTGNLESLQIRFGKPFELGPRDLRDLPEYFGLGKRKTADLSRYSVEIIAEINYATRLPLSEILQQAKVLYGSGADLIDIGGVPGESSNRVAEIVAALCSEGMRVSIDSFDRYEVEQAVSAGAELILSCNHSNADWVGKMGVEVVAIPDSPDDLQSLDRLILRLQEEHVLFRVDPILEPIGIGFLASLERYISVRRQYPDIPMMMGIGNVTELTEVDSAGVNMLLAAICEELGIQSVLTTQVINWCRTAVAEFDRARRLVHHAVVAREIPKHLCSSLVMLRDPKIKPLSSESLRKLAASITDANFRIFAENGSLHLMNNRGYWTGTDAFQLFDQACAIEHKAESEITPGHAFYLGYELARAELALHLGKQYTQDESVRWGLLGDLKASSSAAAHK